MHHCSQETRFSLDVLLSQQKKKGGNRKLPNCPDPESKSEAA
jgi:hypothetical protein